jgi:hypothetical protein
MRLKDNMGKEFDDVDCLRHKINYDGDHIYVVVSHEAKEVFISSVNDQKPKVAAIYDSLTRMISMAWQHNKTEYVVRQLYKASRSRFDLPGILAELIRRKGKNDKS